MTQLERLKLRLSTETLVPVDAVLEDILHSAEQIILNCRYPSSRGERTLEARYEDLQIRIAIEIVSKEGAEGQIAHSENGVSRSYESASISPSLLREIVPFVGVGRIETTET